MLLDTFLSILYLHTCMRSRSHEMANAAVIENNMHIVLKTCDNIIERAIVHITKLLCLCYIEE